MDNSVSLTIDKSIVNPIVEAKIKEALLAAMGGQNNLIQYALDTLLNQRCDVNGSVSHYSSDNKYRFIDVAILKNISDAVKKEVEACIIDMSSSIKNQLIKKLKSEKGASAVADALLEGFTSTFGNDWRSDFKIEFKKTN